MDEDQLSDLKQFIVTTVSQATAGMATKDGLQHLSKHMNRRFDELQDAIADTISTNADANDERFDNLEKRVTKLEHQAA